MKNKFRFVNIRASRRSFIPSILTAAFVCSLLASKAQAADRWWDNVGGTANDWGSVNNWSTVVGGGTSPGAIPSASDLVIFNASSLTATQTISLGGADRSVLGISMINATNAVTIQGTGTNNRTLNIAGSGISKTGTGAITIGNVAANTNANVRLTADQTWTNSNNTGAITIQNTVSASTAVNRKLTLGGTSTASNTINGVISNNGAGIFSLEKIGAGTWILSGANGFTGGISLTAGTLATTVSGALNNNNITVTTPATLSNNAPSSPAAPVTTTGTLTLNGTGQLTIINNGSSTPGNLFTVSGIVSGSGGINLQRGGSGTVGVALTNPGNNFTGPIQYVAAQQNQSSILTVGSLADSASPGAGNIIFGSSTGQVNITQDFNYGSTANSALVLTNRQFELAGPTAAVSINNASGQAITINSNLLVSSNTGKTLTLGGSGAGLSTFVGNITNGATPVTGTTPLALAQTSGVNTLTLASVTGIVPGASITGTGIPVSTTITAVNPLTRVVTLSANTNNTNTSGANVTVAGVINTVSVAKTGTGTWVLSGANTYTGTTAIAASGGTLQLGSGNTEGSLSTSSPISVGTSAAFAVNQSDTVTQGTEFSNLAISGAGGFSQLGSGTTVMNVANTYTGATTIGNGTLRFTTVSPSMDGGLNFGTAAASVILGDFDLSTASATFGGATTVRTNNTSANTISIGTTQTLTLNGGLTVGYSATAGTPTDTLLTASGLGSMAINGTNLIIGADASGAANSAWTNQGVLDVTGLTSFATNVTNINLGVGTVAAGTGELKLSNTANTLIATTITVGNTGANNGSGTNRLTLGTGTNVIQADLIEIGKGKSSGPGVVAFASQAPASPGTVTIANKAGSGAANITIANVNGAGTGAGAVGTLDLRGHVATVNAGTLLISQANHNNAGNASGTNGTIRFDDGTFTVATLNMAPKTGLSTGTATATLNVGGGDFTVNTAFTLGSQATAGNSVATLNLTGGTFSSFADIVAGAGSTNSTINLDGSILNLNGNAIGGAVGVDTLEFKSGGLQNVSQINNGATGLTKTTSGTLILAGTNSYTGATTVSAGLLTLDNSLAMQNSPLNTLNSIVGTPTEGLKTTVTSLTFGGLTGNKNLADVFTTVSSGYNGLNALTLNPGAAVSNSYSGDIGNGSGNLSLTKTGAGSQTLSANVNTYTGGTFVNAGSLTITGSLPTNTALTLSPTVAGGAALTLFGGMANPLTNVSALALGSVTGPSLLGLELGANSAASDSLISPNAATTAGTVNLAIMALPGFGSAATYDLISAPSGLSGATYVLASAPGGYAYTLTTTDALVQLGVTAVSGDMYWRGNTSDSWSSFSGLNTNWFTTAAGSTNAQATPGAGSTVNFSTVNASNSLGLITTTLDNNYTVNDIVFGSDPNGVNNVTIAPGVTPLALPGTLAVSPSATSDGLSVGSNAGNITISAPIIVGAEQTWSVDGTGPNGSSLTITGAISGSSTLNISGLVTLSTPAGVSTHNGTTNVPNGGILQGGVTNSFSASSNVNVTGTGIVRINGINNAVPAITGNGIVENNHAATAATLTVGDATDFTFSGTLQNGGTGTLGLTKTGAGKLTLNGPNTHTGMTTVNNGTLILGTATTLTSTNNVTLSATGILDLNGFDQTIGSFTSAATNTITNNGASTSTNTLTISTAGPTLAALITDGATSKTALRVNNNLSNTQITTNAANTFSGGIILAHTATGTRLSPGTITGTPWGTGPITIGEAPTDKAGIYFGVASQTMSNPIIMNTALGTDRIGIRVDAATTFSGQLTANLAPVTFATNSATATGTVTGKITGLNGLVLTPNAFDLAAARALTIQLENTAGDNDYAGDTIVNLNPLVLKSTTLLLNAVDQIPNGTGKGNVTVNSNGTGVGLLSLGGFSETINGLNGNGLVDGTTGTPTLTLGDNNASGNFSGVIQDFAGTLTVTKIGSGTQTFSGASTFSGALNVNGGLVEFATSPATGGPLGDSPIVNLSGGGLSYTAAGANALSRPVAVGSSDGTINVANVAGALTIPSATSTAGNLIKIGSGTLIIPSSTILNAGVQVNEGTLQAGFGTNGITSISVATMSNLDLSNGSIEALVLGNTAGALTLSGGAQLGFEITNAPSNDSIEVGAGGTAVTSGVVTLNLFGTVVAGTYDLLKAPSGLATANYTIGVAPSGFNYVINESDTLVSVTVTAEMPIYWRGGQNLSWNTLGSGSANWTTDSAGVSDALSVPVAADAVIFSATGAPSGNVTTTLDAAFTVDSLQFSSVPGSTDITIAAGTGGVLTLSPVSTTGGIRVLTNGGNATISAPLTVGTSQTWDVDSTGSLTISGDTTFTGNVNKINTGALTLSGTNTGAGAFTLSAGTLNINSPTALGNGVFTIGLGTTINTPASAVALVNNNVQNWNGNFTFTGANDLNLGTGAVTLGTSLIATTSANTLTVGGNIGDGGNNRGLTKAGAGTMVLNGANSYTGLTAITGGVLRITNNTALGTPGGGVTQATSSALEIDGSSGAVTVGNEALTITGGGITNFGALRNIAGDNTYGGTITMMAQSRINSDSGTLTLSNPTSVSATNLTLVVGGAGNTTISGAITTGTGGVAKDGTGILTLGGVNNYTGNTTVNGSTLNITGSINGNTTTSTLAYGTTAGKTVVNHSGVLTAHKMTGADVAGAVTVFNQTAGSVTIVPTNGQDVQWVAKTGYGALNITGGIFNTGRFDLDAQAGTDAVGTVYVGGTGVFNNNVGDWLILARGGNNLAQLTVGPGGSLVRGPAVTAQLAITMDGINSHGTLNIAGGSVDTGLRAIQFGFGSNAIHTGNQGFVNLAGGTLNFGLAVNQTNINGSTAAYFNFAGGTLKANAAIASFIPATSAAGHTMTSTIFGPITNNNNANTAFNTQIGTSSNFIGGLTVDTNGFATTFTNAFLAASGFGVTQANIGDVSLLSGNSGYIGAPAVVFSNPAAPGAVPASGYAVIDPILGTVTGIVITNPGVYAENETPTITLSGGGGTIAPFATSALGTANISGGLTKINPGTLTLTGLNTYTGATLVSGGTLQLNGSAAGTPATSAVTISSGGTLAFTTASPTSLNLSGKDMTLSGGTLAFDIGDAGINDAIIVDDFTLTANSAFSFNSLGGTIGGTYTLVTSTNPITNSGPYSISGQTIGRVILTPTINTSTITVGSSLYEGKWALTGGGNWSLGDPAMTQDNWLNYKPTVAGDAALFGDTIVAASTVAVDTPHIVGYMRFDNANAYTIGSNGSNNLLLNNGASPAAIAVTSGAHTIAENVALLSNLDVLPAASTQLTMSGALSGTGRALDVNGLGSLVLSGANTYTGTTTVTSGKLTVTGSTNQGTGTDVLVAPTNTGNAVLNIQGPMAARWLSVGRVTGASGAVNISTGGSFTGSVSDTELGFTFGAGATTGGYGSLRMTGGTVNTKRFQFGGQNIAAQNGVGVGLISGGIVNADSYVILARHGTTPGTIGSLTVATGGTLNHTSVTAGQEFSLGWQGVGRAELNLTGGNITSTSGRSFAFGRGTWTGTGIANLNAGTLTTTNILNTSGTSYLNFNGGTLKAVTTQTGFLPALTGVYVNGPFGTFDGGAVIDSNGVDITVAAALIAPTGDGVATIPVTNGGSGYIGAPAVSITDGGAGFGATAIANMVDDLSGNGTLKIDSITITNPGNNYTAPAVSLIGGGNGVSAATLGTLTTAANTSGGLTKEGLGILILNATNTYTGLTSVNAGMINVGNVDALGTTAAGTTVASGARVVFNALATNLTVAEAFAIEGTGTTATNGALNMGGSKIVNLSGAITLTDDALVSADGGATLNFTGVSGIAGTDTNFTFTGSGSGSITGPISLGTGSLTKSGAATLTLSGDNDYSGGTALSGGIIQANHNNALGSDAVVIAGTRLSVGDGITIANPITIDTNTGAGGRGLIEASAGTAIVSGPITINATPTGGGHFAGVGAAILDVQGVITSSVGVSSRTGIVKLTGGGTGYTDLTVGQGTVMVGANDGIATTAEVTIGASAAGNLDLNGFNQSLVGIIKGGSAGIIGNSSTTADSVLTTTGTSLFAGLIQDVLGTGTRTVALTVASGDLTLTNTNSSYSGGTTVNQGTLSLGANGRPGASTGTLSVNNTNTGAANATVLNLATAVNITTGSLSGTIAAATPVSPANTATINIPTGRTFTVNQTVAGTYEGSLAGDGGLTLGALSTNTLTLTGVNTYTGATSVAAGTLALVGGSQASPITVSSGASLSFTLGSPTTSTSSFDVTAGTIKISGTPTLPSYTLISSSTGISGTPTLDTPIPGYNLKKVGNTLVLENSYLVWANLTYVPPLTQKLPGDDQDTDGLNNLREFAFGTDPTVNFIGSLVRTGGVLNTTGQPILEIDTGVYYAVFGRRTDYLTAGVNYTVEFSAGLDQWTASVTVPTTVATDGVIDAVRVPFPNFVPTLSGPKKPTFFRVVISN